MYLKKNLLTRLALATLVASTAVSYYVLFSSKDEPDNPKAIPKPKIVSTDVVTPIARDHQMAQSARSQDVYWAANALEAITGLTGEPADIAYRKWQIVSKCAHTAVSLGNPRSQYDAEKNYFRLMSNPSAPAATRELLSAYNYCSSLISQYPEWLKEGGFSFLIESAKLGNPVASAYYGALLDGEKSKAAEAYLEKAYNSDDLEAKYLIRKYVITDQEQRLDTTEAIAQVLVAYQDGWRCNDADALSLLKADWLALTESETCIDPEIFLANYAQLHGYESREEIQRLADEFRNKNYLEAIRSH